MLEDRPNIILKPPHIVTVEDFAGQARSAQIMRTLCNIWRASPGSTWISTISSPHTQPTISSSLILSRLEIGTHFKHLKFFT